jgi:ATP-binding cassette subfamily B protein
MRRGFAILGIAVRTEPWVFAVAVLGSAVYGVMTVGSAWVLGRVTDRVVVPAFEQGRTTAGALVGAFAALLGVALLRAVGVVARRLGAGIMQYRLQATYRRKVTRQYLRLPLKWHQRHPTGQLLSNASSDVDATWYPIAPLPMAVGVLVMLVVAGVAMVLTDLWLALVAFCVFPAIFALNVAYQRRLSPLATRAQQLRAEVSGVAHESFEAAVVVKTLGREAQETARFRTAAEELRDAQIRVSRVRAVFDPVLEALPNLGVLAVLLLGAGRVASGALAAGDLVQVAYLFTLLAFPVRAIGWVLGELPRSVVGYDRVRVVLDATGETAYGDAPAPPADRPADLRARSLAFGYDGVPVLTDVSLEVEPGRTVAVVGATGAGKSTLTTLLVRLVDPDSGAILLDGLDVRSLRRGALAGAAAVVPQQAFLFDDTVRGNVTLGGAYDDAAVWDALRAAQADGFVRALSAGLDTELGERGASLSGGQRQRLALARALVRHPRLLVLDDATSAVDPHVEAAILAGLRTAAADSSVVVVAHRKATIALADEVVFVAGGRVAARGTHPELLATTPAYRELVNAYDRQEADLSEEALP